MNCTELILFSEFFLIFLCLILGYKLYQYRNQLEKKNIRLIQLYLDSKFMWKGMINNLNIYSSQEFCHKFISDIKEYYHLEDIIIVDSIKMLRNDSCSVEKNAIFTHIERNADIIINCLKQDRIFADLVKIHQQEYCLYISSLTSDLINDGYIICIEKAPSLLDEHELISLENALNLLKSRLIYD